MDPTTNFTSLKSSKTDPPNNSVSFEGTDVTRIKPPDTFLDVKKGDSSLYLPVGGQNAALYAKNMAFQQQVVSFNPALYSYYYGTPALSPGFPHSNPSSPNILFPPGLPHIPAGPGFLTGAGYQLGHTGSAAPLRTPGPSPLMLPGQAGTPLHFTAIIGDKIKLAEVLQEKPLNLECRDGWGRVALVYTVLSNHQECTEMLLRAGARPDTADAHGRTPLHYAAYKGHLGCIKAILHTVESRGPAPVASGGPGGGVWLAQDQRGVTPLHHAAVHHNHKCLQALLKYAAPGTLDTLDHKKRTPLHWAAAYGSEENVRLLIKHGANNLMPDQEGKTPLHWASMSKEEGAKSCVRVLISAAPSSVNWQDFDGITALHLAVAEARKDTVEVILSVNKCNVDLTDNQFRTALHWACNRGLTAIVGRLVERGSNIGAVDVYGATPLHYAAQLNHTHTVELLMRRPCVRDDPTKDGHTALLWAAARGADSALAAMVRHGASVIHADPRGCTALHIAAGAGHVATVRVLLTLRAPLDTCDYDGRTPLLHAAQSGHAQIVKVLAKSGASLDHRDNEGQCALHHSVLGGHLFLAQRLIRAGTSVNVQDYSGRTPLHMAAFRGFTNIMYLLLENRGDVNARDHQGQSALHWAAQQGHLGAVNTLLDFHAYPNYTQSTPDRYTALDCAYVAEQLEVAEVLMSAGGVSVTGIMEVAAIKIQALVRGFMARHRYELLTHQRVGGTCDGGELNKKNVQIEVDDSIQPPQTEEPLSVEHSLDDQLQESFSSCGSVFDSTSKEQKMVMPEESPRMSPKTVSPRRVVFSDSRPLNSVFGQRWSSRNISSSLRRRPRKKTQRNLDLPGPGELGIVQPMDHNLPERPEDAAATNSDQDTPLAIARVLRRSGNIAAAVVSVGDDGMLGGPAEENMETENCIQDNLLGVPAEKNMESENCRDDKMLGVSADKKNLENENYREDRKLVVPTNLKDVTMENLREGEMLRLPEDKSNVPTENLKKNKTRGVPTSKRNMKIQISRKNNKMLGVTAGKSISGIENSEVEEARTTFPENRNLGMEESVEVKTNKYLWVENTGGEEIQVKSLESRNLRRKESGENEERDYRDDSLENRNPRLVKSSHERMLHAFRDHNSPKLESAGHKRTLDITLDTRSNELENKRTLENRINKSASSEEVNAPGITLDNQTLELVNFGEVQFAGKGNRKLGPDILKTELVNFGEEKINTKPGIDMFKTPKQTSNFNIPKYNIKKEMAIESDNNNVQSSDVMKQPQGSVILQAAHKYANTLCPKEKEEGTGGEEDGYKKHGKDKRQMLEEKMTASVQISEKENPSPSLYPGGGRPVVSAEARRRARERWNNKLASLTLQTMQRPSSALAGNTTTTSFSYNLLSTPNTPRIPTHKHKPNNDA